MNSSSKIVAAKKETKNTKKKCIQMRPRNLYLIKDTLETFGQIQLPSKLDVLKRTLCYLLVDKKEQLDAYDLVADEIIKLYNSHFIRTLEKNKITKMISDLIKEYFKIFRNQQTIDNLSLKDKIESKDTIIEIFEEENDYLIELGDLFNAYDENALRRLKELKKNGNDGTYDFFMQQKGNKNTGLVRDVELRFNELLRKRN